MTGHIALKHSFGDFQLDAEFSFPQGVTALFGPSGAGKSTIVSFVAGFLAPQKGRIVIDGRTILDTETRISLSPRERMVSVVFQDSRLFPHLSIRNNLLYGWRRRKDAVRPNFDKIVELLALQHLLERKPRMLSGGEKSRAALGRALLAGPRALLLDEPLASLDAGMKAEILPYLDIMARETRIPILFVSHSIEEVTSLAEHMAIIRNGRIVAEGSLFDLSSNLDVFNAIGLKPGTVLAATIKSHDEDFQLTTLSFGADALIVPRLARNIGEAVRIRIAPEEVMLSLSEPKDISANNVFAADISDIRQHKEGFSDVQLAIGNIRIVSRITRRSTERLRLVPGSRVYALIKSISVGESKKD